MNVHVNSQITALPVGAWKLDPSRTTITVTATKLGFFSVPAMLTVSAGTVEIDADHQVTAVEVIADAASYTSRNAMRNDHVRSASFLDVDRHPDLIFHADKVKTGPTGYHAEGSITVKGRRSPLTIDVTDVDIDAGHGSLTATATLDRNALGVDRLPSFIVGRHVQLTAVAHMIRLTPDPRARTAG